MGFSFNASASLQVGASLSGGLAGGLTAGLNAAVGALGKRLDPYLGYNFMVEIDGLLVGGFSRVQGIECTIETEDRIEGGVNDHVHRVLKHVTHPHLVLSHGLTDVDGLWSWYDETRQGRITRRNGTIMLLDRNRLPAVWWDFTGALPVKWSGPSLDAGQDGQVAIETLELIHRGITKPLLSSAASAARLAVSLTL